MSTFSTRRQFLAQIGAVTAGAALPTAPWLDTARGEAPERSSRVIIARDDALAGGSVDEHRDLLRKLLEASMQRLTGSADSAAAWRRWFKPTDRVGIKVNTLGHSTQPAVVDAVVAGLRQADVPAENIIIWDRFDAELGKARFRLNRSAQGVKCYGTDAESIGSGYQSNIETSGQIGSCYSRIIAEQIDALISVPVLKDHSLAGVSLGMKNFYGAIHNPNKYHDHNCDPYVVDVVSHRFVRPRWRLTVCDATRGQCHGGPMTHPGYAWPFGGLIIGADFVAVDAVGADLLDGERKSRGLKSLADDKRPTNHIATAGARGLGVADLSKIERIEL
jgi:uncharacterized protein (DUF362 family)